MSQMGLGGPITGVCPTPVAFCSEKEARRAGAGTLRRRRLLARHRSPDINSRLPLLVPFSGGVPSATGDLRLGLPLTGVFSPTKVIGTSIYIDQFAFRYGVDIFFIVAPTTHRCWMGA
jgi:hypothetical protein